MDEARLDQLVCRFGRRFYKSSSLSSRALGRVCRPIEMEALIGECAMTGPFEFEPIPWMDDLAAAVGG